MALVAFRRFSTDVVPVAKAGEKAIADAPKVVPVVAPAAAVFRDKISRFPHDASCVR